MKECSQSHQNQIEPKGCTRALSFSSTKRQNLEVNAMTNLNPAPITGPVSLGPELPHVVPDLRVAAQPMGVDEDTCLGGDVVAVDCGGAERLVRNEERPCGVHAEGFTYDAAQVIKVGQV